MKNFITTTKGNLYKLAWESGGEMPVALGGYYTSEKEAHTAGSDYIITRNGAKNAKNSTRAK